MPKQVAGTQDEEFVESLSLKTKFGQTVNPALRADSFSIGNFSLRFFQVDGYMSKLL